MHYLSPEFGLVFVGFLWLYWWLGSARGVKAQNLLLLVASYLFYCSFDWRFAFLLLNFSLVILALAQAVQGHHGNRRRWPVIAGVVLALVNLGIFKYYNFFREESLALLTPLFNGASLPVLEFVLPVGISFYTFQGLAYLISVGRGECKPANLFDGLLHLSFFPTLLAGPICRPNELLTQIQSPDERKIAAPEVAILLIISALIKKVWLSAWLAEEWVNTVFANPDAYHSLELLCGLMAYAWQLFFDFSGYTDVVTALALLLGFSLPVNFRQPYLATSLSDFWRRWHITLSRWIRDYVYISLGGNRASWGRTQMNLLIAMVLSGFWHGASATFIVWGLWHGLGLIAQNCWQKITSFTLPDAITQWLTFAFVCFGWLLFRAEDWESVTTYVAGFSRWDTLPSLNWMGLLAAMVVFFMLARRAEPMMEKSAAALRVLPWWGQALALVASALLIMELAPAGMPGFIYFGF
ncbi:MBOAT family O-acyltransferase [Cellvibrio fibrivorans]|uniref:Probable alginate O-acetylase n=1 Tax=Cellvibrio fibrivorans TaxID=126350 RepID=A0ABU1UV42_9GAMM|nr:MBOAT family O-acyltransferase [Cellvibrio fibrivorans]MDR7088987.1 D-alanyl-lipoteichoic acid acyltransferase DltB (MBOAT superfamily) [Cellvibrio fibrivorans]